MGLRQIEQLLHALPQTDAEELPLADSDERLGELETAVEGVLPGIEETREPRQAVRRGEHQRDECHGTGAGAEREVRASAPLPGTAWPWR